MEKRRATILNAGNLKVHLTEGVERKVAQNFSSVHFWICCLIRSLPFTLPAVLIVHALLTILASILSTWTAYLLRKLFRIIAIILKLLLLFSIGIKWSDLGYFLLVGKRQLKHFSFLNFHIAVLVLSDFGPGSVTAYCYLLSTHDHWHSIG